MKPEDWISSKEQRPQIGELILAHHKSGSYWAQEIRSFSWEQDYDYWTPIVPPPKPDPFETWWWAKVNTSAWGNDVKEVCRRAWDAALKSKETSE